MARVFDVTASGYTGAQERVLSELTQGAQRREYTVVLVWSLDWLTRQGVSATLEAVNRLVKAGCHVVSLQEPWLEVGGEMTDLLLAITGWVARFESARRSERVRAGLAGRRAHGLPVGRVKGAKDNGRRRRTGYLMRYAC